MRVIDNRPLPKHAVKIVFDRSQQIYADDSDEDSRERTVVDNNVVDER